MLEDLRAWLAEKIAPSAPAAAAVAFDPQRPEPPRLTEVIQPTRRVTSAEIIQSLVNQQGTSMILLADQIKKVRDAETLLEAKAASAASTKQQLADLTTRYAALELENKRLRDEAASAGNGSVELDAALTELDATIKTFP